MTTVLLAVEAVVLVTTIFGGAAETSIEAANSPCSEVKYLEKLIMHFEGQISQARQRASELSDDYSLLTLAAACDPSETKAAQYTAIAAQTKEAEYEQRAELTKHEQAIKGLLDTLKSRAEQTRALLHAEHAKLTPGTATASQTSQPGVSTNSDEQCTVPTTQPSAKPDTCDTEAGSGDHVDAAVAELPTLKNIKLVPDSSFLPPAYDIVVAGVGNLGSGGKLSEYKGAACAAPADNTKVYGSLTRALGIKSITKKAAAAEATVSQQLCASPDGSGDCVDTSADTKSHLQTQKKVANAICQHKAATIKIFERPIRKSKATLASEGSMRALSQLLKKGKVNTKEEPTSQTEAVKALLPAGESTLTADLVDPLENEEITYDKDNNPVKTMIKDANKAGKLATTLAFCFGRQQRRKSAITAQKEVSDTKTEKKCKDTEKNKCTADKDCEYSEGKCKLKEGVKVEGNDKKTANTTGSNSFVIKKTPLLLEF